jgi:hypothetical protein
MLHICIFSFLFRLRILDHGHAEPEPAPAKETNTELTKFKPISPLFLNFVFNHYFVLSMLVH